MGIQVNIRFDEASVRGLDEVADVSGRSRSWLVQRAVREFVAREQRHIAAVRRGVAEADAGLGRPADEVFAKLDAWIEADMPDDAD
jgi:predicted transcriptional regulator